MRRSLLVSFLLLVAACFFQVPACASEAEWNWGPPEPSAVREWTILVYMDGDNNLEKYALDDLQEMEQGIGMSGKVEVIVLLDRAKGYAETMGNWTGARAYRVKKPKDIHSSININSELIADCGELNMGDPNTLESFVRTALKKYPAKKTALVMWDHGGGWLSMANDEEAPGAPNGIDALDINELRSALEKTAPLLDGNKFELLFFNMCIMGQSEVIAGCAPFSKYMLAPSTSIPVVSMDYIKALGLFENGLSTPEILKSMVTIGCNNFYKVGWTATSLSVYDLSKVDVFLNSFKALSDKISEIASDDWRDVTRTVFYTLNYAGQGDYMMKDKSYSSIDLINWLDRMKKMPCGEGLKAEIEGVKRSVSKMLIATESGQSVPSCNGIAFYAPLRSCNMNHSYKDTDFNKATGWYDVISKIHEAQERYGIKPPKIVSVDIGQPVLKSGVTHPKGGSDFEFKPLSAVMPLSVSMPDGQSWVKIVVEGEDILWVYGAFAFQFKPEDDYIVCVKQLLSSENIDKNQELTEVYTPVFKDGRNELMYQIAGQVFYLYNGTDKTLVCPNYTNPSERKFFSISGTYSDPAVGKDIPVEIKLSYDMHFILSIIGDFKDADGKSKLSPLTPSPEGVFTPKLTVLKDGKMQDISGKAIKWNNGLSFVMELAPKGSSIKAFARAESLGGSGEFFFGEPLTIAANPLLEPYIEPTHMYGAIKLPGRYASCSGVPLKSGGGFILAPNGGTVEIFAQGPSYYSAVIRAADSSLTKANLIFNNMGLPTIRLTTNNNSSIPNTILAMYAVLVEEGRRYSWRMINGEDGAMFSLFPLNEVWFPHGYLNGEWTGQDGSKLSFSMNNITFSDNSGSRQGNFTMIDNIVRASFSDGSVLELYTAPGSAYGTLVVAFADSKTAMIYSKTGEAKLPAVAANNFPVPPFPNHGQNPFGNQQPFGQQGHNPFGNQPLFGQQPSIDGVWEARMFNNTMIDLSKRSIIMTIRGGQYQVAVNGQVTETGRFQIQGNMLIGQNNQGQFTSLFQLDQTGNVLIIANQGGATGYMRKQ